MGNSQRQNNDSSDNFLLFMVVAVLGCAAVAKYSDKIEAWFWNHIVLVTVLAAGIIYGIYRYSQWKFKMKHPEIYERELALKQMEKRNKRDSNFSVSEGLSGSILVGHTLKDHRLLTLTPEQRSGHVQIVGATGRGKTASVIQPWFVRDLAADNIPILIDGKGDPEIVDGIRRGLGLLDTTYWLHVFDLANPEASESLNPLYGGCPQEVADRLIASLEFESVYFRDIQHAAVLLALEGIREAGHEASLGLLYDLLADPGKLQDMLRKSVAVPEHLMIEVNKLASLCKETREERFSGLLSQLRPFASGELRRLTTKIEFDLVELIREGDPRRCRTGGIILLNAMQFQKAAKVLGKLILQTTAWASSTRGKDDPFVALYVDEFSSFVYDGFEQFLNKARSRNVGLHISHQSVGDLEAISPSFAKTVNVNTNVKVLLGLNDPDTADYFAKHLGTRTTQKITERARTGSFGETEMVGEMSLRDVEQYKIHPNKLKNYSRGQGVLSLLVHGIPVVEEVQFERSA